MTASALLVPGPLVPAVALALVVYVIVLWAAERVLFRDDLEVFVGLLPGRLSAWSASRSQSDRRSA
jgi:hypothetical protein